MRLYGIAPAPTLVSDLTLDAIVLGEDGRGRHRIVVPCPQWAGPGAEYEFKVTRTAHPCILPAAAPSPGWIARVCTRAVYTRNAAGRVEKPVDQVARVTVLAMGHGAHGEAGRIGSWEDALLAVSPPYPVSVWVKPDGGHKTAPYWLVFQAGGVARVECETAGIWFDAAGIPLPHAWRVPVAETLVRHEVAEVGEPVFDEARCGYVRPGVCAICGERFEQAAAGRQRPCGLTPVGEVPAVRRTGCGVLEVVPRGGPGGDA